MDNKDKRIEYDNALRVIRMYEEEMSRELVKPMKCCVCKAYNVSPSNESPPGVSNQESGMWDDGSVSLVNYGYGSKHDFESYLVAICDNCTTALKNDSIIKSVRDVKREIIKYKSYKDENYSK